MSDRPTFRSWAEDFPHDSRAMPPVDHDAFRMRAIQRARGERMRSGAKPSIAGRATRKAVSRAVSDHRIGQNLVAEETARRHRAGDIVERAKRFIQSRGYIIVRASLLDGPEGYWDIAARNEWLTDAGLLHLAGKLGFAEAGAAVTPGDQLALPRPQKARKARPVREARGAGSNDLAGEPISVPFDASPWTGSAALRDRMIELFARQAHAAGETTHFAMLANLYGRECATRFVAEATTNRRSDHV